MCGSRKDIIEGLGRTGLGGAAGGRVRVCRTGREVLMMEDTLRAGRPGVFHLFFPSLSFLPANLFLSSDGLGHSDK